MSVQQQTKVFTMPDALRTAEHQVAEDHAAIAAVIHRETTCFKDMDLEGWSDCHLQSEKDCAVCASLGLGVSVMRGWEAIHEDMASALALGRTPCGMSDFRKDNMQITIEGDSAWVVYDGWMKAEDGSEAESIETVILKLTNEGWRIVYNAFAHTSETRSAPGQIALDAKGHIVWSAPEAASAMRGHPALIVSHGRIRARRGAWDKVLQAAVSRASALHGFFHHADFRNTTGAPFRTPIVLGEDETGAAVVCSLVVMNGLTYLDIDPTADLDRRMTAAQMVFGLSPGQMSLAARIASGESLTDAAKTLGISVNTARTHLKRIYDKTGVNAQTALVRLLLSIG